MTKIKNYIGIDISKCWLDVAVLKPLIGVVFQNRFSNDRSDLEKLKTALLEVNVRLNKSSLVVCENTGIYKNMLIKFFTKQRCLFAIEHPQQIKKSLGVQRGKNDQIDAKRIAEYALTNHHKLTLWTGTRKEIQKLKDLLINRERLIRVRDQLRKSLKEFARFYTVKDSKVFQKLNRASIVGIESSLNSVNCEIRLVVKQDFHIARSLKLLMSVPGIGEIIGLMLICYTNEFSFCSNGKQLACYVGVAPFEHGSGSSIKGKTRVSHIANKRLKALLHMGAMSAIRLKNGEFGTYFNRKVAEGKNKMSVLNAVKNKIILRAVAAVKRGTPYVASPKFAVSTRKRSSFDRDFLSL